MNIGVIKYRKYEERVLMDNNFSVDDLFRIITEDEDFVWFNIEDPKGNVLVSTWYPDKLNGAIFIEVLTIKRHEKILWTNYNAYRTPQYIYGKKVHWTAGPYWFKRKGKAQEFIAKKMDQARFWIKRTIK